MFIKKSVFNSATSCFCSVSVFWFRHIKKNKTKNLFRLFFPPLNLNFSDKVFPWRQRGLDSRSGCKASQEILWYSVKPLPQPQGGSSETHRSTNKFPLKQPEYFHFSSLATKPLGSLLLHQG